jgi:hypothetical protein
VGTDPRHGSAAPGDRREPHYRLALVQPGPELPGRRRPARRPAPPGHGCVLNLLAPPVGARFQQAATRSAQADRSTLCP